MRQQIYRAKFCSILIDAPATDITAVQMETLWPAMVAGVSGKSWHGKEKVLEAFVLLATKGKQCFENDEQKILELKKVYITSDSWV